MRAVARPFIFAVMKCPACFNELTPLRAGHVTVDACHGGCGGIWFDAFELQRVSVQPETANTILLSIQRDPSIQLDASRKRPCPRCSGVKLKRRQFSPRCRVEVDECPGCAGFWLDAGELDQIRDGKRVQEAEAEMQSPDTAAEVFRFLIQGRGDAPAE